MLCGKWESPASYHDDMVFFSIKSQIKSGFENRSFERCIFFLASLASIFPPLPTSKALRISVRSFCMVCGYGQIVVDGKLIKDYGLYAIEQTAAVSG